MKNKKGFTLVELVIVVGLLGLFGVSIGLSLNNLLKKSKDDQYDNYVSRVESSANTYITSNSEILEELFTDKGYVVITAEELIDAGLLDENTINPETNEPISYEDVIKVYLESTGTIGIEYQAPEVEEDYLQVMDIVVEINSSVNNLCYNGINGNGLRYVKADGTVTNSLKSDRNIKCDNSKVNISKLGTYSLEYEYQLQTDTSKWKQQSRNVTVVDTVAPVISSFIFDASTLKIIAQASDTNGSGIEYYYFGKEVELTNISNNGFKIVPTTAVTTQEKEIDESGLYYFYAQDVAGNLSKSYISVTLPATESTSKHVITPGPDPDITCTNDTIVYLKLVEPVESKIGDDGYTYYKHIVATESENLSCRQGPGYNFDYDGGLVKGRKYFLRKVEGDGYNSIQWYYTVLDSGKVCYSAGTLCVPYIEKKIKTDASGFDENRDKCWTSTINYRWRDDVDMKKLKGTSVFVINIDEDNDSWFYAPYTGTDRKACLFKSGTLEDIG